MINQYIISVKLQEDKTKRVQYQEPFEGRSRGEEKAKRIIR